MSNNYIIKGTIKSFKFDTSKKNENIEIELYYKDIIKCEIKGEESDYGVAYESLEPHSNAILLKVNANIKFTYEGDPNTILILYTNKAMLWFNFVIDKDKRKITSIKVGSEK